MLIKKIKLHNIRSYSHQTIDFPSGSVLLSGDIGSGKSTILLAIEFALFGSDTDRVGGSALLRKGATEASVELALDISGTEVIIKRGLKKSRDTIMQTPGWIMKNGMKKDAMPIELKSEIIQLLGYPEELVTKKRNLIYRYTVYCPQEEMKLILLDEKEARLDMLRRIFGVDKYKRIRENCAIIVRELKMRQRVIEARAEGLKDKKALCDEKKLHLTAVNQKLAALMPLIQQLQQQVALKRDQLKKVEIEMKAAQDKKRELGLLKEQEKFRTELLVKNEDKMKQLETIIKSIPKGDRAQISSDIEQREKRLQEVLSNKKVLEQKILMLSKQIEEAEIEAASDPTPELEKKKSTHLILTRELEEKEKILWKNEEVELQLRGIRNTLKEYEVRKAQAHSMKQKILQLATCPTCLQPVTKEHKDHVHAIEDKNIIDSSEKIRGCMEELKHLEGELSEYKSKAEHMRSTEKQHAMLGAEIKHLEAQWKKVQERKNALERLKQVLMHARGEAEQMRDFSQDATNIKNLKEQLERAKERAAAEKERRELSEHSNTLHSEIKQLNEKIVLLEHELTRSSVDEKNLTVLHEELDVYAAEERDMSIQCAHLKTEREADEEMIITLENEIQEKEKMMKTVERLRELRNWLEEHFVNLMTAIEKHVMTRIYREFNELFKQWFSILIADENMSARVDDGFNPVIEQNGHEIDVEYLSGGERTSAALAYRLALNKVVNDVIETIRTKELLILDEPTEGFSSEQLDRVREVLDQLGVKQVIIVSHESKIESFVENTLRIVKEEGVSKVVIS